MLKSIKITSWIIVAIIIIILMVVGFSREKSPAIEGETIKIGATLPLTGNYAYIGQSEANGLKMAIDEINAKKNNKGYKLDLIIEDNQGDPKEAVNSVNKMIDVDGVDIIFSAFTSITGAINDIVLNKEKILFYNSTVSDIADNSKYVFRDYVDTISAGSFVAKVVNKLNYQRVGYLGPNDSACSQMREVIENEVDLVKIEEFLPEEKDLKNALLKLKSENIDAIASCSYIHAHILMKQLKELGMIDIPTIQGWAHFLPLSDADEIRELFKENKTLEAWYAISEIAKGEKQRLFFEKYKERFGLIPSPAGLYSYDDGYIINEAIKKCDGRINNDCFAEKINNQEFEGIAERIKFDENGNAIRKTILLRMNDDLKWEEISLDEL